MNEILKQEPRRTDENAACGAFLLFPGILSINAEKAENGREMKAHGLKKCFFPFTGERPGSRRRTGRKKNARKSMLNYADNIT